MLVRTASPAITAPPDLAAAVLRARLARRRSARVRVAAAGAAVAAGLAVAAAVLPGGGTYFDYTQPSAAMEPTVAVGQVVVAHKTLEPERGDLVILLAQAGDQEFELLSRAVGLPGDVVECPDDGRGRCDGLVVSGRRVPEPWLREATAPFGPVVVEEGQLFVLGDARGAANDSRYIGTQERTRVRGVVVAVRSADGALVAPAGAPRHELPGGDRPVDPADPVPPAGTSAP